MSKTNLFMNWSEAQYVYAGPTTKVITQVVRVGLKRDGQMITWSADASSFLTLILMTELRRQVVIETGDIGAELAIPQGATGTLTLVLNDAKNGAGSGALTLVFSNAVYCTDAANGEHNKIGLGTLNFECFSSDGATDPLAVTQAP